MKLPVLHTGDFRQAFQQFALQFPRIHTKSCSSVYSTTLASHFQLKCNPSLVWPVWCCQLSSPDAARTCSGHWQPATQNFTIKPWKSSTKWNYGTLARFGGFFLFFFSFFLSSLCLNVGGMSWLTCFAGDHGSLKTLLSAGTVTLPLPLLVPGITELPSLCAPRGAEELGRQAGASSCSPT